MSMSESALNLLLQIPLAGVVVFVVVVFLRYLREMTSQMLTFMSEQAETNRKFLATQRQQMNEAIGRMAEEIKLMRIEVSAVRGQRESEQRRGNR